jgi:hypothetical protein
VRSTAPRSFKLPEEYFQIDYDRSKVSELQALLKFDNNCADTSKFVPVIYPSAARACHNDRKIFQVEELAKVHS